MKQQNFWTKQGIDPQTGVPFFNPQKAALRAAQSFGASNFSNFSGTGLSWPQAGIPQLPIYVQAPVFPQGMAIY